MKFGVYYSLTTGLVESVSTGPDFMEFSEPGAGQGFLQVESEPPFPSYVDGTECLALPDRPSAWHQWDGSTHAWTLTLPAAAAKAWAAVKARRNGQEFGAFSFSGMVFDGDEASQRRINLAAMGAQAALVTGSVWSIDWTLADNSVVTLAAADMVAVAEALGSNITAAHEWARALRAQIAAAQSVEEIDALVSGLQI